MWNHAPEMRKLAQDQGLQWTTFKESELRDLIAYLLIAFIQSRAGAR